MSYNYLPLDRKQLFFDQVKNLLDYDQLVSITFDAHEQILKCREFLDEKLQHTDALYEGINLVDNLKLNEAQIEQLQYDLLVANASSIGYEVPVAIVKLALMLKIKSLSYGYSGVQIDTVKRLMEMYNSGMFPILNCASAFDNKCVLSQLGLPLMGFGDVNFNGEKMSSAKALELLNWQPLQLKSKEALALINGVQFTVAYGLFCLKRVEQLLAMADIISATSFKAIGGNPIIFKPSINKISQQLSSVATAEILYSYLISGFNNNQSGVVKHSECFITIPQIHGAVKTAFTYVLDAFMSEANSVSDNPLIFPDEDVIIWRGDSNCQHLALAAQSLINAIGVLVNASKQRTIELSVIEPSFSSSNNEVISVGKPKEETLLSCVENAESVLAIELLTSIKILQIKDIPSNNIVVKAFCNKFSNEVLTSKNHNFLEDDIAKAIAFIKAYTI